MRMVCFFFLLILELSDVSQSSNNRFVLLNDYSDEVAYDKYGVLLGCTGQSLIPVLLESQDIYVTEHLILAHDMFITGIDLIEELSNAYHNDYSNKRDKLWIQHRVEKILKTWLELKKEEFYDIELRKQVIKLALSIDSDGLDIILDDTKAYLEHNEFNFINTVQYIN